MAWQLLVWHRLPLLFGKQHTPPGQSSGPSQANPCEGHVPAGLQTFSTPMQHSCWPSVQVVAPHAAPAEIAASIIGTEPSVRGASPIDPSSDEGASCLSLPPSWPHATSAIAIAIAIAITEVLSMVHLPR